jgi:peptidoglycan/LPS O-acetylase OafA/YrhL
MEYRREIDGLRAIAVIPVILFHAGFNIFSGGYVGVDIFFVISGYLIATILMRELESGQFSLSRFYERRARRILPALFFIMLISLVFAWMWLPPREMKDFSRSLIAVSLFTSNILFWRTSGYFETAAELNPLLHTWSLSVEEQFYLLFPVMMMLLWRRGRQNFLLWTAIAALISLLLATWASTAKPLAAFYLLPARVWELLVGVLVAFHMLRRKTVESNLINEAGGMVGLILISLAVFGFDRQTAVPGAWTLIPTLGTALIILFTSSETIIGKLLGARWLVGMGLISYSTYLWHQPILAFARIRFPQLASEGEGILLLLVAIFVLSLFTWRFIESPFRNRNLLGPRTVIAVTVIGIGFFTAFGFWGIQTEGYRSRLSTPPNIQWMSLADRLETQGDVCDVTPNVPYPELNSCVFGDRDAARTVVLYGDSHAQAISRELDVNMARLGYKVLKVDMARCGIVFDITSSPHLSPRNHYEVCNRKFRELQRLIQDQQAIVLLVTRWTFQFYPMPGHLEQLSFDNGEGGAEITSYRENFALASDGSTSIEASEKKRATLKLLNGLASAAKTLYVSYPIPETGWNIFKTNVDYFKLHQTVLQELSFPYVRYLDRNRFILNILAENAIEKNNAVFIRPDLSFCQNLIPNRCVAQKDGVPFYYDGDHLSDEGAKFLVDEFVQSLMLREQK